jgi:hypothetical protein
MRRHAKESRPIVPQGRDMSAVNTISSDKLARLIGAPMRQALIDVRVDGGGAMVTLLSCSGTSAAPYLSGAIAMGAKRSTISTNRERER